MAKGGIEKKIWGMIVVMTIATEDDVDGGEYGTRKT